MQSAWRDITVLTDTVSGEGVTFIPHLHSVITMSGDVKYGNETELDLLLSVPDKRVNK